MRVPQVAVGAIVFLKDKILLVKRKNEPAAGQWAIPGGKVKWGETLKSAAEREIYEETRVRIRAGEPVYTLEYIGEPHYIIIDLVAEYVSGVPTAGDDAQEARWIGRDDLKSLDITDSTRKLLKEKYNYY